MRREWVDTKLLWIEKAEQSHYQRYPSDRSPCVHRLRMKVNAKEKISNFKRHREEERSEMQEPKEGEEMQWWAHWWRWERSHCKAGSHRRMIELDKREKESRTMRCEWQKGAHADKMNDQFFKDLWDRTLSWILWFISIRANKKILEKERSDEISEFGWCHGTQNLTKLKTIVSSRQLQKSAGLRTATVCRSVYCFWTACLRFVQYDVAIAGSETWSQHSNHIPP